MPSRSRACSNRRIDARLYLMQEQFPEALGALSALSQSNAMAFELAQWQRIQLFFIQKMQKRL